MERQGGGVKGALCPECRQPRSNDYVDKLNDVLDLYGYDTKEQTISFSDAQKTLKAFLAVANVAFSGNGVEAGLNLIPMASDLGAMSNKYTTYGVDFFKLEKYQIRLNNIRNTINQEIGANTEVMKIINRKYENGTMPNSTRNEYNRLKNTNKILNGNKSYIESEINWIDYVYQQGHVFGGVKY